MLGHEKQRNANFILGTKQCHKVDIYTYLSEGYKCCPKLKDYCELLLTFTVFAYSLTFGNFTKTQFLLADELEIASILSLGHYRDYRLYSNSNMTQMLHL